jgi:hypothetical protein
MMLAGNVAITWAVLFALGGVALGVPAVARNGILSGQAAFHLLLAVLAMLLCYADIGLRRQQRAAPFVALVVSVVQIALAIAVPALLLLASAAVSLAFIALVVSEKRLGTRSV